ncbi:MAG: hypothetical protein K9W43_02555 [Candidatus Thorarchaeota archaeon]|nr:hypothetical protein [Candidatus Thorarchaeota archaeon]
MNSTIKARRVFAVLIMAAMLLPLFVGPTPVAAQTSAKKIVFDYSHGQYSSKLWNTTDLQLANNLTALGYEVVWAYGGINNTILSDAVGLVLGSIYGDTNGYLASEVTAIANWFNAGGKFLWVGYDSDYSGAYINDNMTQILEAVGSHVYGEPTSIEDAYSNCGAGYRPVANGTSNDPFVADIVAGTTKVLMHGPTLLYGSNSSTPAENTKPIDLETGSIANVYPLLYYGASATIADHDLTYPYAHEDGDKGAFVAATLEIKAGDNGDGVIIVSGASPYGDYQPMCSWEYKDVALNGDVFVKQAIDFGIDYAMNPPAPAPAPLDMTLVLGAVGVVIVVIIVVAVLKKK